MEKNGQIYYYTDGKRTWRETKRLLLAEKWNTRIEKSKKKITVIYTINKLCLPWSLPKYYEQTNVTNAIKTIILFGLV